MTEQKQTISPILSFLRGGNDVNISSIASNQSSDLARCIKYIVDKGHHRNNLVIAIVKLLNDSKGVYRGSGWKLIQEIPLSYLTEIVDIIDKNKDNTKRLRHAIATKIANESRSQIFRAFFINPDKFRRIFEELYIPRDIFNNEEITNESYKLAYDISKMSTFDVLEKYNIKKIDLLAKFGLPLHMVMDYIQTPEEAMELANTSDSKSFFEHARWYRNIAGDEMYEKIAKEKLSSLKDPLQFLSKKDHLIDTGAITDTLMDYMEDRASEILEEMMKDFNLDRIALITDISSSMNVAVEITNKLYNAFSRTVNIDPIITFNSRARKISKEELPQLRCDGMTKISSAFNLLEGELSKDDEDDLPQAIILISDLEETVDPIQRRENNVPRLDASLNLIEEEFGVIPLVVLHCGNKTSLNIDYPHAKIEVDDFHERLTMDIMKQTARNTSRIAVKEKKKTRVLKERTPIEEEISQVELPKRPKKSYQKGYLENLLINKT